MLVYRSTSRRVDVATAFEELEAPIARLQFSRAVDQDLLRSVLIDAGELEAALVDRECPTEDDALPLTEAFNDLLVRLGAAFVRSWDGSALGEGVAKQLRDAVEPVRRLSSGDTVDVPISEGFAFYGLFPETYIAAARDLVAAKAPRSALVIGVRSIGTTLSAVVAATLASAGVRVDRITVRPRGHPFDRELRVSERLARAVRSRAGTTGGIVAIVDEGPGISGSSFASVAEFVSRLGFADEQIVFLPSWDPPPGSLRSVRARERWARHDRFLGDFDREWIAGGRLARNFSATVTADVSAGAWRERKYSLVGDYPGIHPQHERRKYLGECTNGTEILIKFEGLGRYGEASVSRARRLASAGIAPQVHAHRDGFTATTWVEGAPLRQSEVNPDLLRHVGRYIAWIQCHERRGVSADPGPLLSMLESNVREGLGPEWAGAVRHVALRAASVRNVPAVRLDNRMMLHEWLRTPSGFIKTDAASHYDDHFYPGPHDIAWDLAGASIELGLDESAERRLIGEYVAASGDDTADQRLPFMRATYLAFRLGYATMAAESLGEVPDGHRMRREINRYAAALHRELIHAAGPRSIEDGPSDAITA